MPTRSDDVSNANLFTVTARDGAARGLPVAVASPDDDNDAAKLGILRTAARVGAPDAPLLDALAASSANCGDVDTEVDVRSAVLATASSFWRCASAQGRHISFCNN